LFDKDPLTAQPADLPLPYSNNKNPPSVRATIILVIIRPAINISFWLVIQDFYPEREIVAELSNEDNNGQKEPTGDDAECEGVP
jgi:hypothetical protein